MNVERLNDLLDVLLEVKKENLAFNMRMWARFDGVCFTVGCAAGWYIIKKKPADLFLIPGENGGCTIGCSPNDTSYGSGPYGYGLLAEHFDISRYSTERIFDPNEYQDTSIDHVIERVREIRLISDRLF